MTEARPDPDPADWTDPAPVYDEVAASYAERFLTELSRKPFDCDLLDRFAAAFACCGFQPRTFDAPNGWFLDKGKLLSTHDWYPVPADGDGLI